MEFKSWAFLTLIIIIIVEALIIIKPNDVSKKYISYIDIGDVLVNSRTGDCYVANSREVIMLNSATTSVDIVLTKLSVDKENGKFIQRALK